MTVAEERELKLYVERHAIFSERLAVSDESREVKIAPAATSIRNGRKDETEFSRCHGILVDGRKPDLLAWKLKGDSWPAKRREGDHSGKAGRRHGDGKVLQIRGISEAGRWLRLIGAAKAVKLSPLYQANPKG